MASAVKDLTEADSLKVDDPRVRLALCKEWMLHEDHERALLELNFPKDFDDAELADEILDPNDWHASRFVLEAELQLLGAMQGDG